ncbi:hypothetical protein B0H14DRAFT_3566395, partial [Mycena olivaceomarginata]
VVVKFDQFCGDSGVNIVQDGSRQSVPKTPLRHLLVAKLHQWVQADAKAANRPAEVECHSHVFTTGFYAKLGYTPEVGRDFTLPSQEPRQCKLGAKPALPESRERMQTLGIPLHLVRLLYAHSFVLCTIHTRLSVVSQAPETQMATKNSLSAGNGILPKRLWRTRSDPNGSHPRPTGSKVLDPLQQKLERLPDPSGKIAAAKARVGAMQSILPAKKQRRAFDNTPLAYLGIDQEFLLFNAAQIAKLLAAPRATTEQMQQLCARIARIDRRVGDDARFYSRWFFRFD